MKHPKRILGLAVGIAILGVAIPALMVNNAREEQAVSRDDITTKSKFHSVQFETISEWNDKYRLHVMYPKTHSKVINDETRKEIDPHIASFRAALANQGETTTRPYDLNITGTVDVATDKVVHFVYTGTQYTGGQTNTIETSRLYDINTGNRVMTSSLFNGTNYLDLLSTASRAGLQKVLGAGYDPALVTKGTEPNTENFDVYELVDEDTIVFVFEPGQVAAQDAGIIKLTLPTKPLTNEFSDVSDVLFPTLGAEREASAKKEAAAKQAAATRQQTVNSHDCAVEKCVAISFDDGPGGYGGELLDLLDQHSVKASFFYIGQQVSGNAANVKRAHDAGHDIGNHTWSHIDMANTDEATVATQIQQTNQAIASITGTSPKLIRPPYGSFSQTNLAAIGLPFMLWNVDPDDWKDKDADTVYSRVMANVQGGSVVLSHEIYPTTIAAYGRIIPDLLSQGYVFVTLSDMFNIDPINPPAQAFYSYK